DNLGFHLGFDRVRRTVFQCVQHITDPASQLGGFGFLEATAGDGRGTDTYTRGDERRTRVVRNGVFVHGDVGAAQSCVSVFTGVFLADQVDQEQVVVSTAGHHVDAALNEGFGHGLSVLNHLRLVGFVFRSHGFFEAHGFGSDDVHQRAALRFREDGEVELFVQLFVFFGQNQTAARTAQGFVSGGGDDVGVRHRAWVHASGDQTGHVGHVDEQVSAYFVGDFAEFGPVDHA